MTTEVAANGPDVSRLEALIRDNARKTKSIYATAVASAASDSSSRKRIKLDPGLASEDPDVTKTALSLRLHAEYDDVQTLPDVIARKLPAAGARKKKPKAGEEAPSKSEEHARKLIEGIPASKAGGGNSNALVLSRNKPGAGPAGGQTQQRNEPQNMSLSRRPDSLLSQPRPDWHPPWKLQRVISGHLGWVRALAVEPNNQWFASGAGDRTIKIWDLASGQLRLTLTGHISTVRGLAVSPRHPYMFSCGEDKMVKCWDLETNKVVSALQQVGWLFIPDADHYHRSDITMGTFLVFTLSSCTQPSTSSSPAAATASPAFGTCAPGATYTCSRAIQAPSRILSARRPTRRSSLAAWTRRCACGTWRQARRWGC